MDKLLRADEKMFAEEEQWQTVSQLEVNEPGRHDALSLLRVPLSLIARTCILFHMYLH